MKERSPNRPPYSDFSVPTRMNLWFTFLSLLGAALAGEWFVDIKPHFGFDDFIGFYAVFGFAACAAIVLFSTLLGFALKRREDYYCDGDDA